MAQNKIILYYQFAPIADPQAVMLWQRALCEKLGLRGRILISKHGINGTLGGEINAVKAYTKETRKYPGFKNMEFKWSEGGAEDFPRLSVKARDEIVAFGAPDELQVDETGVVGGGVHLKPEEVNKLVEERGDEVVFFDGRNAFEAKIGKFKNAIVPTCAPPTTSFARLSPASMTTLRTSRSSPTAPAASAARFSPRS